MWRCVNRSDIQLITWLARCCATVVCSKATFSNFHRTLQHMKLTSAETFGSSFLSFENNLCAFALSSFGCGVFWRTNGVVSFSAAESSLNFTCDTLDASRASQSSLSDSSRLSVEWISRREWKDKSRFLFECRWASSPLRILLQTTWYN